MALNKKSENRLVHWILYISAGLMLAVYGLFEISRIPQFQLFGDLVYRVNTEEKVVALTFDDGPKPGSTQTVLEILNLENVRGTFYLNGAPMRNNPAETKLIIDGGHEIGNHAYSHRRMVFMSYDEVAREVTDTSKIIREMGYKGEISFRPPYGKSLFVLPYYLQQNNITTVTWDVESETFREGEDTPEKIVQRTLDQVKPGSIILMHLMYGDGSTLEALPTIIKKLKAQGYRFATVGELRSLEKT